MNFVILHFLTSLGRRWWSSGLRQPDHRSTERPVHLRPWQTWALHQGIRVRWFHQEDTWWTSFFRRCLCLIHLYDWLLLALLCLLCKLIKLMYSLNKILYFVNSFQNIIDKIFSYYYYLPTHFYFVCFFFSKIFIVKRDKPVSKWNI